MIVTKVGALRGADASWISALTPADLTRAVHDNLRNLRVDIGSNCWCRSRGLWTKKSGCATSIWQHRTVSYATRLPVGLQGGERARHISLQDRITLLQPMPPKNTSADAEVRCCSCSWSITGRYGMDLCDVNLSLAGCSWRPTAQPPEW